MTYPYVLRPTPPWQRRRRRVARPRRGRHRTGAFPLSAELAQVLEQGLTPGGGEPRQRAKRSRVKNTTEARQRQTEGTQRATRIEVGAEFKRTSTEGRTKTCKNDSNEGAGRRVGRHERSGPAPRGEEALGERQTDPETTLHTRRHTGTRTRLRAARRRIQRNGSSKGDESLLESEAQERGPVSRSDEEGLEERQLQRRQSAHERGEAQRTADGRFPRGTGNLGSTAPSPTLAGLCRRTIQGATARGPARQPQLRRTATLSRGRGGSAQSPARPTTPLWEETACDGRTPGGDRCSPTRTGRCVPCVTWRTRT